MEMMTAELPSVPTHERLSADLVVEYRPALVPILEGRAETAWDVDALVSAQARFSDEKFLSLPGLLSAGDTAQVAEYYRVLTETDWMTPAYDPARWVTGNDPVGRALLRQFLPLVEAAVGHPLRESYTFTADYLPGAMLPMHVDRLQCEYTISLLLDYDSMPAGECSPWPLDVELPLEAGTLHFHQARGEGVLLKGRELPHGRTAVLEWDRCLVIMLHYVNADFPDALMEPY